ncbi:hypothetical protein [Burkholderia thailandensis]|uniref:hypothetical protein n=1 Tax=Burkholderia thailandensis TaxID=57975 RepID=UPI001EE3FF44|nr:hypothetical protein [Burkholderia thailandensis]
MTTENSRADALTKLVESYGHALIKQRSEEASAILEMIHGFAASPVNKPAAAPIDEPSVNDTITFSGDSLTLSGAQLLEALDFIAPDRDADQLESEVTIQYGEGHTGKGMYCWCTEYPEEGAIFIDGSTAVPAAPAPSPADERAAFEVAGATEALREYLDAEETWRIVTDVEDPDEIDPIERTMAASRRVAAREAARKVLADRAASANETRAEGAEPCVWLVEWTPNVSSKIWVQSFVNELDAINKQRQVGGRIIACAPIESLSRSPAMAAEAVAIYQVRDGVDSWADTDPVLFYDAPDTERRIVYRAPQPAQADAREGLTDEQIDMIANDGHRNAAGGIYATSIYDFARACVAATHPGQSKPLDMLLFCPKCGVQHIDHAEPAVEHEHGAVEFGAWDNPPHRSHLCHACGTIWRPADVPTNGVAAIATRGKADTWDGKPEPRAEVTHGDTTMGECMASLLDRPEAAELYADRYRYLRERPLNAVSVGGVFAGKTPDNVVLNGADLDAAIDAAIDAARAGGA